MQGFLEGGLRTYLSHNQLHSALLPKTSLGSIQLVASWGGGMRGSRPRAFWINTSPFSTFRPNLAKGKGRWAMGDMAMVQGGEGKC